MCLPPSNRDAIPAPTVLETLTRELMFSALADAVRIEEETFQEFGPTYSHEIWRAPQFMVDKPGKWELSLGALVDHHLVGFLVASVDSNDAHLHRMAIDRNQKRREVAIQLMEGVASRVRRNGTERMTLSVSASNVRAQRLFVSLGYQFLSEPALERYAHRTGRTLVDGTILTQGYEYRIMSRVP